MKKFFRSFIALCLVLATLVPTAFAAQAEEIPQWYDVKLTEEEIAEILALNTASLSAGANTRASDLISYYSIGISKSGTTMYLAGKTTGTADVKKSGFKEIVIQRRINSNSAWSDYITYEDLYTDAAAYTITKAITVPTGYQYRVTCVHYAKKNIFSVQKIDNISNTVTF